MTNLLPQACAGASTPGGIVDNSSAASSSAAGRPPTTDLFAPCVCCGHDPKNVVLDPEVWTKIIWAAKESEDWRLRTLIEQAVMGPKQ